LIAESISAPFIRGIRISERTTANPLSRSKSSRPSCPSEARCISNLFLRLSWNPRRMDSSSSTHKIFLFTFERPQKSNLYYLVKNCFKERIYRLKEIFNLFSECSDLLLHFGLITPILRFGKILVFQKIIHGNFFCGQTVLRYIHLCNPCNCIKH